MRIVKLTSENVKRINAVTITPAGDIIIIGGDNGQGKTSILDSIEMALGGSTSLCPKPLHEGASRGRTVLDLGDIVVTRTFTEGGSSLTVKSRGAAVTSPQSVLDALVGKLTFDPLGFLRMKPKEQTEVLRSLVGINFTELNDRRQALFDQRTDVNRELKQAEAHADAIEHQPAPAEEQSAADLTRQLEEANAHNLKCRRAEAALKTMGDAGRSKKEFLDSQIAEVERIKKMLAEAEALRDDLAKELEKMREQHAAAKQELQAMNLIATDEITGKIADIEVINRKVRKNKEKATWRVQVDAKTAESADLTAQIEAIDAEKVHILSETKFPVEGLSFDDNGITFNGIPFEQASGAEALRVSVAIGMAANPKLKILLCRDGSLLDNKSLKLLSDIVTENDYQLWLERVGDGKECSIIIEDGYVAEDRKQ